MKGLRNALAPLALVLIAAAPAAGSWEEAMAAFNERRYAEAAAGFAAGAEASPDDPRWHYMLGVSLLKGGRPGVSVVGGSWPVDWCSTSVVGLRDLTTDHGQPGLFTPHVGCVSKPPGDGALRTRVADYGRVTVSDRRLA